MPCLNCSSRRLRADNEPRTTTTRREIEQQRKHAAQACEDYAREICAENFGEMALERQHDGQVLTARITSSVVGREIKPRTVRQWLQALSGNSRPSAPCI